MTSIIHLCLHILKNKGVRIKTFSKKISVEGIREGEIICVIDMNVKVISPQNTSQKCLKILKIKFYLLNISTTSLSILTTILYFLHF